MGNRFLLWVMGTEHEQKINYGLAMISGSACAIILIFLFLSPSRDEVLARNRVDQRNHQRDRVECTSKGGLLGEPGYLRESVYSVCHDVDSLITLTGDRELYRSP